MMPAIRDLWRGLACWFWGHDYVVIREFGPAERMVGCRRCGQKWAMNDRVKTFVPWTGEFTEMYRRHGHNGSF